MSQQVLRGSGGEYQADELAGVTRLSWRVSQSVLVRLNLYIEFEMSYKWRCVKGNRPKYVALQEVLKTW